MSRDLYKCKTAKYEKNPKILGNLGFLQVALVRVQLLGVQGDYKVALH